MRYFRFSFLFSAVLTLVFSCSKKEESKAIILASAGGLEITAHDFKSNYEFGYAHLKTGKTLAERKLNYLNWMLNEKLLALEGYNQGLDKSDYVEKNEKQLNKELMIEELLNNQIKPAIHISDNEIHDAINKSKVHFKFRYWPSSSLQQANELYVEMKQKGFDEVLSRLLKDTPEINLNTKDFTTDYLTWEDVPENIFSAIQNLQIGEISLPVPISDNTYMLFQLLDFRREAVTENEYHSQAPTVKKTLYQRKYQKAVTRYVDSLMTPLKVKTKSSGLTMIADALEEWKENYDINTHPFSAAVNEAQDTSRALFALNQNQKNVLSTYKDSKLTISEFLAGLDDARFYTMVKNNPTAIRSKLNQQIALYIRDQILLAKANELALAESDKINHQLQIWKDKWVFEQMIYEFIDKIPPDKDNKKGLSETDLNQIVEKIRKRYNPYINKAALDTINVNESESSRWAGMMIVKGGTNRPVVPVADPRWVKVN